MPRDNHQFDRAIATVPLIAGAPWAISREVLPHVAQACRAAGAGGIEAWTRLAAGAQAASPRAARQRPSSQRAGGMVAVIPLCGVLTPRGSFLSMLFGGAPAGLMGFRESFREAVSNPDVGAIVIDVDSPGGLHTMTPETGAEVFAARGSKPIISVANAVAASGAYWIASQADEVVVTPSGDVGSIGSYILHEDWSGWNEQAGIDPTYIYAGRYKVDGNADEPLSDSAREEFQGVVDSIYAEFLNAVAQGRGVSVATVRADYGEGRCLRAEDALAAGMVDRVDTLEAVVGDLLGVSASTGPRTRLVAPSPRSEASAPPAEPAPPVVDDSAPDEPDSPPEPETAERSRCSCGRFIEDGETQCADCKQSAVAAEDDSEPAVAEEQPAEDGAATRQLLFDLI